MAPTRATTRAKFVCNKVTLSHTQIRNPEIPLDTEDPNAYAKEHKLPLLVPFAQPTVECTPVYDPQGLDSENAKFFAASPAGKLELTINNPAGAEVFEIGKSYYVDITQAPS